MSAHRTDPADAADRILLAAERRRQEALDLREALTGLPARPGTRR